MKRLITIILLSLTGIAGLKAQMVVTDPTQTASNAVGFLEQLRESMDGTVQLLNIFELSQDQLERAEKTIQFVEDAAMSVRGIQEMLRSIQLIENTIRDVNYSIQTLKRAVSQKWISINEGTAILRSYSGVLSSLTALGNTVLSVTTEGMERMTQYERMLQIKECNRKIGDAKNKLEAFHRGLTNRMNWRYILDTMRANDLQAQQAKIALAADIYQSGFMDTSSMDEEIVLPPAYIMYEVNNAFNQMAADMNDLKGGTGSAGGWGMKPGTEFTSAAAVKNEITNKFHGLGKVFLFISAIVGLIGAFQVYRKYQFGGEDLTKNIAIWIGSTLLLFVLGIIFNI
ncbi:MAG: DUF4134 domain-containing protein [Bacteroidales bacterium]|nr:DUF4134 domain-containing protein [Bacteroidales bacterium]